MNLINPGGLPNGRQLKKTNPRFGTHFFAGSHRYVYYADGRPRYFFSDRPYTLEDAKKWKNRCLVSYLLLGILCLIPPMENLLNFVSLLSEDSEMSLIYAALVLTGLYFLFRAFIVMKFNPEDDPMLKSFICTDDLKKPPEVTCPVCGGVYSQGAHTTCPHCGVSTGSENRPGNEQ